jgi:lipoyl-dependent peroxiredoxin
MPTRIASAEWNGGLKGGNGTYKGQTALGGSYNFGSRFQEEAGSNPEELLAAAEASCFSMALASAIEKEGFAPTRVATKASCTVEKAGEGMKITRMMLETTAVVPGLDDAKFQALAMATKEGCIVSSALKGNVQIDLKATLSA